MALVLKDRVKETSVSTGTGPIALAGATGAYEPFSIIGNGNQTYYAIAGQTTSEWEVGIGTYTTSTNTLSRDTILSSSNSNTIVTFSAGTKDVFITYPAEKAIYEEPSGETLINAGPITVIGAGVTSIPSLPAELGKFIGDVDSFAQIYTLNQNDGSTASADVITYNDLTTDGYTYFTDMGISSSNYTSVDYPIFTPNSGYVFHQGADFFIGNQTTNKDIKFFSGGVDVTDLVATFSGTDKSASFEADVSVGGTINVTGAATFGSTVLLDANPTTALQAATKQYVDNQVTAGLHIHDPVRVETTGNLNATYVQGGTTFNITDITSTTTVTTSVNHGLSVNDQIWLTTTAGNGLSTNTAYFVFSTPALNQLTLSLNFDGTQITGLTNASGLTYATRANSGVGATLTNAGTQIALTVDGIALSAADRVMVRLQTNGAENGVYVVTTVGSGSTNWVLTRSTDANMVNPGDPNGLGTGDYFFTQEGVINAGDSHVLTTEPNTMIIGYTTLTYTQFSGSVDYVGGTNINVTGQTISLTGTVAATNGGTGTSTVTTGDLLYGSATNTWSKLPLGTAYKSLVVNSGGTQLEWNAVALNQSTAISGALGPLNGGTGQSAYTLGDIIYSSATDTLAKLAGNTSTTKQYLSQTGTGSASAAPSWASISASDIISGTLPAVRGGTGQSSYAIGDLLYADTTTTLAKLAATATGRVLISNGVSAAPSWSTSMSVGAITGTSITDSGLTSGRVTFASTGGLLADSSDLTWTGTSLLAPNFVLPQTAWTLGTTGANASIVGYGSTGSGGTTNSLVFNTNTGERMRIDSSGNVGIGTTAPLCKLAVGSGSVSDVNVPIQINSASAAASYIGLNKGGTYGGLLGYSNGGAEPTGLIIRTVPADPITFITGNTNERMRITSAGNVGIGVTTPGQKLTVAQGAKATTATALTTVGFETTDTTGTQLGLYFRQKTDATAANRWTGIQSYDNGVGTSNLVLQDLGGNVGIGTTTPRQQLSVGATLDLYSGGTNSPTVPSVRGSGGNNIILNGVSTGAVYLNYDAGTGGVNFCNGALGVTATMSSAGALSAVSGAFSGAVSAATATITSAATGVPLVVQSANSSNSSIRARTGSASTTSFSVLQNANTNYIATGAYYSGATWLYDRVGGASLFALTETQGARWYSGTGDSFNNVVADVALWDASGIWKNTVNTTSTVTAASLSATSGAIAGNGSGSDPYGTMAVTEPANANNYSYYGLTRAGQIGAGFGITGSNGALSLGANAFWFGGATAGSSGVLSGTAFIAFNGSSLNTAGNLAIGGTTFSGSGSSSTYGAVTISGIKGGWSGINFKDSTGVNCSTLMTRSSDGYGGFFNKADNNWLLQWDGSGNFNATGTVTGTNFIGPGTSLTGTAASLTAGAATKLSTASGSAPSYSARAWVNFNATGTIAITGSSNVSSITDHGTGIFTVNYTTAMQDATYSVAGTCRDLDASYGSLIVVGLPGPGSPATTFTAAATSIATGYGGSVYDPTIVCLTTFR